MNKLVLSAFFFSLYLQGLSAYFYLTGALHIRSSILTGVFQIGSLLIFVGLSIGIRESSRKLKHVQLLDLLLLAFSIAAILDMTVTHLAYQLPDNILIYFITYTFSMLVARCLTLQQLKIVFQISAVLATITAILLYADFLRGTAIAVNNDSRLAVGNSGNPIEAGNVGAYAALMCLFMSLRAKELVSKLALLALMLPGGAVATLSGTRSAVLSIAIGGMFVVGTTLFLQLKGIGSRLRQFSVSTFLYYLLVLLLLITAPMLSSPSSAHSTKGFSIDRALSRVENIPLLSNQGPDASVAKRYELYENATKAISKNPLWGGRLYSVGFAHNAFLQVAAEFGIFGIVTFVLPTFWVIWRYLQILWIGLQQRSTYFNSDQWLVTVFVGLLIIQALFQLLVHSDPYRSYFPPCVIGIAIAFSRLGLDRKPQRT
ncbi:MAG: O-antigen ligase family protein [Plectolyngbya sp. WJT66-NPBG17]|jgi:O-antigen ligase|nr:O-antigen ligase family protein [Plectolyngbya sp. WJT66-NPBG17]